MTHSRVEVVFANNGERLSEDANSVIKEYKEEGYELVHVAHNVVDAFSASEGSVEFRHWMTLVFEPQEDL
jgi:hypothetical protein